MEDWMKWMAKSIEVVLNEKEMIEVVHAVAAICFYMGRCENVALSAVTHLENFNWSTKSKSKDVIQAEAVLCYALLQVGDTISPKDNELVEKYLEKNVSEILENPYVLAPVLQCIKTRCPQNKVIRAKLQHVGNPRKTAHFINELVQAYALDSFKNVSFS